MPRQSRGRSSVPSRPAAAPASSQSRGAHTAAAPAGGYASAAHPPAPAQHANPAATSSSGPGILGQMAATAGSVAVGSTIGHGLSSMLFGGSSHAAPTPEAQAPAQAPPAQQRQAGISCEVQAHDFTKCLETADLPSCTWYLEQLKACQAAAAPY